MPLIINSLAPSTWRQYETVYKQWILFCQSNSNDFFKSSLSVIVDFLQQVFDSGVGYSSINTARSALSLILPDLGNTPIGSHPDINRFIKGVSRTRPPKPRYDSTWDPQIVIQFLANKHPLASLSLKELSLKCVTLIALCTAHRVQTIASIKLQNIQFGTSMINIYVPATIKTSGPGRLQPCLVLPKFLDHPEWCAMSCLTEYINRTRPFRQADCDSLFISFTKPYSSVGAQTISRWIKSVLKSSGIDTSTFSSHSCRHASTSTAFAKGVPLDTIRSRAGWSSTSSVFAQFYNRPIHHREAFAVSVFS